MTPFKRNMEKALASLLKARDEMMDACNARKEDCSGCPNYIPNESVCIISKLAKKCEGLASMIYG